MNGTWIDLLDWILSAGATFLVLAAWRALPLALIALVVDLAFHRRLAARHLTLLWMVVAVRLLLPFSIPTAWSLQGPFDNAIAWLFSGEATNGTPLAMDVTSAPLASDQAVLPHPVAPLPAEQSLNGALQVLTVAMTVYGLVVVALLLRSLIAHWRFASRLRNCQAVDDAPFVDLLQQECDALRVPHRPAVKIVPELATPAVFGLFRPTICLPASARETLSEQELRWVLRHELAHVRRRDAWLLALVSLVRCGHWLNPVAWLVAARVRMHIETAADDLALGKSSAPDAVAYGRLLLRMAEQISPSQSSAALGFLQFVTRSRLRQRIEQVTRRRTSPRRWLAWAFTAATVVLALVGWSDAASEHTSPDLAATLNVPHMTFDAGVTVADEGPVSLQSFDVSEVIKRLQADDPKADAVLMLRSLSQLVAPGREFVIEDQRLLAEVTPRQHQALKQLLDAWKQGGPQQIVIELRMIAAHQKFAAGIDWVGARVADLELQGPQPVIAAKATDDQLRRFIVGMQSDAKSNIMFAPKVTLFNGQTATISCETQRPFVTAVEPGAGNTHKPIIRVLSEGLKTTMHPTVGNDETVTLTLDLQVSKIGDVPLANLPYGPHDGSSGITVQVPNLSTNSVRGTVTLKKQESLLIAMPQLYDARQPQGAERAVYYALTPRVLDVKFFDD